MRSAVRSWTSIISSPFDRAVSSRVLANRTIGLSVAATSWSVRPNPPTGHNRPLWEPHTNSATNRERTKAGGSAGRLPQSRADHRQAETSESGDRPRAARNETFSFNRYANGVRAGGSEPLFAPTPLAYRSNVSDKAARGQSIAEDRHRFGRFSRTGNPPVGRSAIGRAPVTAGSSSRPGRRPSYGWCRSRSVRSRCGGRGRRRRFHSVAPLPGSPGGCLPSASGIR